MSNNAQLAVFSFQGNEVRTVTENNEVFFVGKDVCERLGYVNATDAMNKHCRGVAKRYPIIDALGRQQEARILSESDVMRLICSSQMPEAQKFEKWVFEEVLPSIRKDGGYMVAKAEETPEQLYQRCMTLLNATIERQKKQIAQQSEQLKLQAPDVEYCHTVLASSSLMTVNTIAVHLGVSAKRLNAFLDGEGWIYKQGKHWCPSFRIRDSGYCEYETVPYINRAGEDCTAHNLKWTEAGRRAVIALWNKRHNRNLGTEAR